MMCYGSILHSDPLMIAVCPSCTGLAMLYSVRLKRVGEFLTVRACGECVRKELSKIDPKTKGLPG